MNFKASRWRGTVRGRIDKIGKLTGSFIARRRGWTDRIAKFSTEYSNGLFEVKFEPHGGSSLTRWKITLTRASPVSSAGEDASKQAASTDDDASAV